MRIQELLPSDTCLPRWALPGRGSGCWLFHQTMWSPWVGCALQASVTWVLGVQAYYRSLPGQGLGCFGLTLRCQPLELGLLQSVASLSPSPLLLVFPLLPGRHLPPLLECSFFSPRDLDVSTILQSS